MEYIIVILICFLILIAGTVLRSKIDGGKEDQQKIIKKRTSSKDLQKIKIGGSLAEKLEKDADVTKKFKVETMCIQAGIPLSLGEYKFVCILCAITLPLIVLIGIKNIYLAIIMVLLGYLAPGQILRTLANKRVKKMEEQCGSFLRIVLERYKTSRDMAYSIENSLHDFFGCEPFYSNLRDCVAEIQLGLPTEDALEHLARACGNRFLARFSDYYKITGNLATHESKYELLYQAFLQYEEDRELKMLLKKEIAGPVSEAYIMVVATPVFMVWQAVANPDYLDFMLNTQTGQIGLAVIFVVVMLCIIFINAKIAAPIE